MFAQYIHAQNNVQGIRGKITDQQTFKPLISANIIIAETNYGTSSKVDGSFEIIGLPEGKYELHISMIGYYPINRIIVIRKNSFTNIKVRLVFKLVKINTFAIMGKQERNYMSFPTIEPKSIEPVINKVTRKEIKQQGTITLIEAMKFRFIHFSS